MSKEQYSNASKIDKIVFPYLDAMEGLSNLSKRGPVQLTPAEKALSDQFNVTVKRFTSKHARKNDAYALRLLDDACAKQAVQNARLKPQDRAVPTALLLKVELLHTLGRKDDAKQAMSDEHARMQRRGQNAHPYVYLMLAAAYTEAGHHDAAIALLEDVADCDDLVQVPEGDGGQSLFCDVKFKGKYTASDMIKMVTAEKEQFVMAQLKRFATLDPS